MTAERVLRSKKKTNTRQTTKALTNKPSKKTKPASKIRKGTPVNKLFKSSTDSKVVPKKGAKGSKVKAGSGVAKLGTRAASPRKSSTSSGRQVVPITTGGIYNNDTRFPMLWDKRFNKPYNPNTTGYILTPKKSKKKK